MKFESFDHSNKRQSGDDASRDRHQPILTALKKAGFTIDDVEKRNRKTVIIISTDTGQNRNEKNIVNGKL